jgi:hypothetical protein
LAKLVSSPLSEFSIENENFFFFIKIFSGNGSNF